MEDYYLGKASERYAALWVFNRRSDSQSTGEKGRLFVEEAIRRTVDYLNGMMEGRIREPELKHFP